MNTQANRQDSEVYGEVETSHPNDTQNFAQHLDTKYLKLLRQIETYGVILPNRTGIDTKGIFAPESMRFDLRGAFPLLTSKYVPFRLVIEELLWMLNGHTNAKLLEDRKVHIWKQWGDKETREMGPIYGDGFRRFTVPFEMMDDSHALIQDQVETDQLRSLLIGLLERPRDRRHIITLWNPHTVEEAKARSLPPCHGCFIQFARQPDERGQERLHCLMVQRSCDMFLGVPFNIASYAALTYFLAAWLGIEPGFLTHQLGDAHIYVNHLQPREVEGEKLPGAVHEQLSRTLRPSPTLKVNLPDYMHSPNFHTHRTPAQAADELLQFLALWNEPNRVKWARSEADAGRAVFEVFDYNPHPTLKGVVAV